MPIDSPETLATKLIPPRGRYLASNSNFRKSLKISFGLEKMWLYGGHEALREIYT
jgi:hypothetical protein